MRLSNEERHILRCNMFLFLQQTEMTAEERRKKHQLELKEQLHEEAKVCSLLLLWDIPEVISVVFMSSTCMTHNSRSNLKSWWVGWKM